MKKIIKNYFTSEENGLRILVAPTGSGKTYAWMEAVCDIIAQEKESLPKNKISRDEESRNRFFYAVTDINVFRTDVREGRCYNVGVIGKGMNAKIQRASRIREISLLRGEDFSDEIIPMMTELHVRNGQMSVLPFPFKYLRESLTIE